jgi:DNA-binding MarR family transcriptional regulator
MSATGAGPTEGGSSEPLKTDGPRVGLGAALRRAWVGYRRRLDAELATAGHADHRFPDDRVLRICLRSRDVTIAHIGRELGITRQGASKIVASLTGRGYVTLTPSPASQREKIVALTPRATAYLAAHRKAAWRIERELRAQVGNDTFENFHILLDALGGDEQPRMSDYIRHRGRNLTDALYLDP